MRLLDTILPRGRRSTRSRIKAARASSRRPGPEALEDRRLPAGFFLAPVAGTIAANPTTEAVADFNRDGRPDLAVLTASGVQVEYNNGSGGFVTGPTLPVEMGFTPRSIAVGDMNRDGQIDLVVTSTNPGAFRVRTYTNNAGAFTPQLPSQAGVAVDNAIIGVVGDFTRDGIPDVALAFTITGQPISRLQVFAGDGDGTFTVTAADLVNGVDPAGMIAGDFDRDGALDVAIVDSAGLSLKINTSVAANPFPGGAPAALAAGTNPRSLVTGDFNRDGIPDIAVASDSGVDLLLGDGMGGLPSTSIVPLSATAPGARTLAALDYNLDGRLDLATFGGDGRLNVLMNTGAPSAAGLFTVAVPSAFAAVAPPMDLVSTDVNGDGQPDLVVAQQGAANNLSVLQGAQDTAGPRILSTAISAKAGTVTLVFQDTGSGMLQSALSNLANYQLQAKPRKTFVNITLNSVTVTPAATPGGPVTVVLSFNPIKLKNSVNFKITVSSAAITDAVGNRLDGVYNGVFPSGNGLAPPADFSQTVVVKKKQ